MSPTHERVVEQLLTSNEPSVVWKVRTGVLGERSDELADLRELIRGSDRARTLLAHVPPGNVYSKWHGAHWVLAALADLGYPPSAPELVTIKNRVQDHWLAKAFFTEFEAKSKQAAYGKDGVPILEGRYRRCGSQQGNALRAIVRLDLVDDITEKLVERLLHWQWPDGGWNCDRNPRADTSSFMETLLPMRGLAAYAALTGNSDAYAAARRAAEVFLERRMVFGRNDGLPIRDDFIRLHYPWYWHYDLLGGLVGMGELDLLDDERCGQALDLLEGKRLADGGWPAEARFYSVSLEPKSNSDSVDWGGITRKRMNPWVTVDALSVLKQAGRL